MLHFETENDEQNIEMPVEHMKVEEYQKRMFIVALPPVQLEDPFHEPHSKPLGLGILSPLAKGLDFTPLVSLQRQHQTRHAATGVRTQQLSPTEAVPQTMCIR